jgi:hypothetical protein
MAPIRIFFSHSHKDEMFREELTTHLALLQRQGRIASWHDRRIGAGEEWAGRISDHLEAAHVRSWLRCASSCLRMGPRKRGST